MPGPRVSLISRGQGAANPQRPSQPSTVWKVSVHQPSCILSRKDWGAPRWFRAQRFAAELADDLPWLQPAQTPRGGWRHASLFTEEETGAQRDTEIYQDHTANKRWSWGFRAELTQWWAPCAQAPWAQDRPICPVTGVPTPSHLLLDWAVPGGQTPSQESNRIAAKP